MPFSKELQSIFSRLKEEMGKSLAWFLREMISIRGGRITPALVSNLKVECYGQESFLKEIASLSLGGPRAIIIEPWDKTLLNAIEKSLYRANLGGSVRAEGGKIFFGFQSLTQEEREKILKIVNEKAEGAKRGLRKARDEAWRKIQKLQRDKAISEDEKFKGKEEIENIFHDFFERIEKTGQQKGKEILS